MHSTPLANNRVSSDQAIPTDVDATDCLILALFVRVVVYMAVLVIREFKSRPVGTRALAVALFLGYLASAPFETRPPVVLAAPERQRICNNRSGV